MPIKYEIDGNVFREIRENWLSAYVREFLVLARRLETDQAGNEIESFQLNDGRIFRRALGNARSAVSTSRTIPSRTRMTAIRADHSVTQPR